MRPRPLYLIGSAAILAVSFFGTLFLIDQSASSATVTIAEATYGESCRARPGSLTQYVSGICAGKTSCTIAIDVNKIGDPAPGCGKEFTVRYQCGWTTRNASIPLEAN